MASRICGSVDHFARELDRHEIRSALATESLSARILGSTIGTIHGMTPLESTLTQFPAFRKPVPWRLLAKKEVRERIAGSSLRSFFASLRLCARSHRHFTIARHSSRKDAKKERKEEGSKERGGQNGR